MERAAETWKMALTTPIKFSTRIRSQNWSEAEERVLVEEWIARKDIMKDPSNTITSKEARIIAWQEILLALQDKCHSDTRNIDQLQKKWNNLKDKARKEHTMERKALNGGLPFKMSELMERIYYSVYGDDSSILPNDLSIKTEKSQSSDQIHSYPTVRNTVSIPLTIFDSISELSRVNDESVSEHNCHSAGSGEAESDGDVDADDTDPVLRHLQLQMLHTEQLQHESGPNVEAAHSGHASPAAPSLHVRPNPGKLERRSAIKRKLVDMADESCRLQLLKERLNIAYITMRCRKELGSPVTFNNMDDVLPADIVSFLKLPNNF